MTARPLTRTLTRPLVRAALPGLLLLLAAAPARADRVVLRTGRVVEGKVVDAGDVLVVTTHNGIEARIPKDQVVKVEVAQAPIDEFNERFSRLDPTDLAGHKALVAWAEGRGLRREAAELRIVLVSRFPNDRETRRALDHVWHDGRWQTRDEYMRGLGLVPSADGKSWVKPEEAQAQADAARAKDQRGPVERTLRRAASEDPAAVARDLQAFDDAAAVPVLKTQAVLGDSPKVRRLALEELGRRRAQEAELELARAAVEDPKHELREAALASLGALESTTRARDYFLGASARDEVFTRTHAIQAVGAFPAAPGRVVPAMIMLLRESTSGFGRVSISIVTQRAYIQDFEISSGGTGQIVAEVADPVVGTSTEGITLETKVISWFRYSVVQTLRRVTGQRFGAQPDDWERWWKAQGQGK